MAAKFTRPKGTQDILPAETWKWQLLESKIHNLMHRYGYGEMRVPTFESTELFARGVGEGTDIVSKEMYTFNDKAGRSMTLRPEVTAGVARSVLENGLLAASPLPLKFYYIQNNFRYEKMQKGRWREFTQWGIECFGSPTPETDVEVMQVVNTLLQDLGMQGVSLEVNSIGCPKCRPNYHQKLREYFELHKDKLCETCIDRLERNPMRILDCKEDRCKKVAKDAPVALDFLCEECDQHFTEVKNILTEQNIPHTINPTIVRGLDYYTKTVFEFVAAGVGTQGTVCGGGRYDGLIEQLGGQPTPAIGFGLGMNRLLMLLSETDLFKEYPHTPILYIVSAGDAARGETRKLAGNLRNLGYVVDYDLMHRSVKAQMKAANRSGAKYTLVLGEDEIANGFAKLKNMQTSEEKNIKIIEIQNYFG